MKQYNIELGKKVIATFRMNYDEMKMKFETSSVMAEWVVEQHPEFKDCARNINFEGKCVYLEFYSIGEPVIVEEV